jgi:hypothetical protein
MALSDNAIGFFLEAEDVSLSKTLATAATNYEKYTKALEGYNQRAFESAQRGLGQVQQLLTSVRDLPANVEQSMKKASGTIQKGLRPITQKVDLAISVSSASKLKKIFGQAVADAMSGANVRLTASLPQRRMAMFEQGVGLRAQYQDVVQPPDMKGKIRPLKKFAEGGVVDGPAGLDKVFAMLTKGEIVIPADVSKKLASMAGRGLKTGEFDEKGLKELIKLTRGFDGDIEELNKGLRTIHDNLDNLTDVTKARLSGAMLQATKRMEDLKDEGEDTGGMFERMFKQILGPARFLALGEGIRAVQDSLSSLQAGAGSAFSTLGGDEIANGIDSINQMNQFLGLSRDELLQVKIRAGQVAKEVDGITFDELGFALKEAAELGIRDQDILFELAKTSAVAAKGLNVAAESATNLGFELVHSLNLSQEGFDATLASMGQLSDATSGFNISAGKLFEQTTADVQVLNTALRDMSDEESQRLIGSFNQIGAVLESQFIANAGEIRQTLAKAFEGGPENIDSIRKATLLTGLAQDDLRKKLESGDLAGLFEEIGDRVQGLNTDQLKALSEQIGINSDELGKFGTAQESINKGFELSQTRIVATGEGLGLLEERARNNRTAWEKMQEAFTDNVASMQVFGVSGAEVLDFFKEFNPLSIIAAVHLGKTAVGALKAAGSFMGLGGAGAQAGTTMASMGGVMAKLGPLLGKIALTAGPILLVGAAVGFLTMKAIEYMEETNAINKETAEKGAKLALTDFGAIGFDIQKKKKSIEQVQKNIDMDLAAGREANPQAVKLLERYNDQLAVLEDRSRSMIEAGKARKKAGLAAPGAMPNIPGMENLPSDFSFDVSNLQQDFAQPMQPAELAALSANVNMATGATEEKLDRNNELMEQMVGLMREQVQQSRGAPATPAAVQGGSQGVGALGQMVAGGDL